MTLDEKITVAKEEYEAIRSAYLKALNSRHYSIGDKSHSNHDISSLQKDKEAAYRRLEALERQANGGSGIVTRTNYYD